MIQAEPVVETRTLASTRAGTQGPHDRRTTNAPNP